MSTPTRAERFLSKISYISFVHSKQPYLISFIWEDWDKLMFNEKRNHEAIRDFFRGRKIKLVVYTPNTTETTISLVDTLTADAIVLNKTKFITNNLGAFLEAKIPEDTVFKVNWVCFDLPAKETKRVWTVNLYWADKKPLEIHGYSIIDNR